MVVAVWVEVDVEGGGADVTIINFPKKQRSRPAPSWLRRTWR